MSDWVFLNKHRLKFGPMGSTDDYGFNGMFSFPLPGEARRVYCVASDGTDAKPGWPKWKHVSVSFGAANHKTPSWEVMCAVKELFFEPEETVIQLHPPKSRWINNHPGCLHLWRYLEGEFPLPPSFYVGHQSLGILKKRA